MPPRPDVRAWLPVATGVGAFALGSVVYHPALRGAWISDDIPVVRSNDALHSLTLSNLLSYFDPQSLASVGAANLSPISLLLHALAWRAFATDVLGHHLLNVFLHALVTALLLRLYMDWGMPSRAAFLAALVFFFHPANVEVVCWISQLKTLASTAFCLATLVLWQRRPFAASLCFAAALLAKATSVFVAPVAVAFDWIRRGGVRWGWIALWVAIVAAYLVPEMGVFERLGEAEPIDPSRAVWLRTIVAIGARYLAMAATGQGVSAFHDPPRATSLWDPWWLAGLLAGAVLAWRLVTTLRRREIEGVFWLWAAAAFVPVSQVLPFANEMADRYLYTILPGLLGGSYCAGASVLSRIRPQAAAAASRGLGVACVVLALAWALQSHERAAIWRSEAAVVADSMKHYPNSMLVLWSRARTAAMTRDADATAAALQRAREAGYNRYERVLQDAAFAGVRDDPRIRRIVREMAQSWVAQLEPLPERDDLQALRLADAYYQLGDVEVARRILREAVARGGPLSKRLEQELRAISAPQPDLGPGRAPARR